MDKRTKAKNSAPELLGLHILQVVQEMHDFEAGVLKTTTQESQCDDTQEILDPAEIRIGNCTLQQNDVSDIA